ncbi:MAG: hypothetical protein OEZ09_12900, partial [Betaproteobacteria bacterium]|nr:hypothetical protein [Betaproteobacteria bacterium]
VRHPSCQPRHQDVVIDPIEGNVDRLPISKTFRIPSPSLERGIPLKAERWSFSPDVCGGVVRICCSCCPISRVR